MTRFLADESVQHRIVLALRDAGYDVESVSELAPGSDDTSILEQAKRDGRIPITNDKDFAELTFLKRLASSGVILLRLFRARTDVRVSRVMEVLPELSLGSEGGMIVIEFHAVRRRPFPPLTR